MCLWLGAALSGSAQRASEHLEHLAVVVVALFVV
jgi:hypothetical protein